MVNDTFVKIFIIFVLCCFMIVALIGVISLIYLVSRFIANEYRNSIIEKEKNRNVKIKNMIDRKFNIGDEVSIKVRDHKGRIASCIFGTIYGPVYGTNYYEVEAHNRIHYIFEEKEIERMKNIGGGTWANQRFISRISAPAWA